MTEIVQDAALIAGGALVALQCLIWSQDERFDFDEDAPDSDDGEAEPA